MATNALATGSIVLSANADKAIVGLRNVQKQVDTWATSMRSRFKAAFSMDGAGGIAAAMRGGLRGLGAGFGTTLGTAIGGPLGGALGSTIGDALGAIPSKIAHLASAAFDTIGDVAKQGHIASAMGLTSEQFTGMAGVAKSVGEDTREFTESITTMGKMINDAVAGVGGAKGEGAMLFSLINRDAKEFKSLRADEAFFKMMGAIRAVQDPLMRTRAIMLAFGEDGGKWLLPLLSRSEDELRKMAAGFEISEQKMADAKRASLAYIEAQTALRRAWRDIVIAAAPGLELLAKGVTNLVKEFEPIFGNFREGFKQLAIASAHAFDAIKAGAGLAAVAMGAMIEHALAPMVDLYLKIAEIAGIDTKGLRVGKIGSDMQEWGKRQIDDFGKTAERWRKVFERGIGAKLPEPVKGGPMDIEKYTAPSRFSDAILSKSKEAFSLEMRHKFGMDKGKTESAKQLDEAKKTNKNLLDIKSKLNGATKLNIKVIG